ncbi:SDR family NAD(P)-dependent oxidoreductase [Ruegeria sp. SCP11]|uniref:SDR family NAD(P)-dependent oxidoreductase n=1 Tax=Ruegeria sp. SCP11 TaxID=3141378 RepID=UPI00333B9574
MTDRKFEGKTVIVSGGAGGCGLAASHLFAQQGAKVAILDIQQEAGQQAASKIQATGGDALFVTTDVSDRASVFDAIAAVKTHFGSTDVLFNHAGTVIVKPFLETREDEWNRLMAINVNSMFHACQAALPHMIEAGGGAIVNTCSVSGLSASAMESAYCVSKGACIQLTRAIATEFRDRNIRCNGVAPGFINTDHGQLEAQELIALGESCSESDIAQMQGRFCEPEEVASAVLFLASEDARFVNGEILVVDNALMATT